MTNPDPYREWTAAHALGALNTDERAEFEAHLAGCEACQQAMVEFAPMVGLLAGIDAVDLEPVDAQLVDAAVRSAGIVHSRAVRSSRRWRAVAGLAAAVALAFGIVAVSASEDDPNRPPETETIALDVVSELGAEGTITVSARDWGTFVLVDFVGLPKRDVYTLWAVADDGTYEHAGSWAYAESGSCRVPGSTAVQLGDLARVVITSQDVTDELVSGS